MFRWRSRRKTHLTWTKKVPEQSDKTEASNDVRASGSMPARMGTRCWSGGGREALSLPKGQGSQAYLSLPPSCDGVS